MGKPAVSSIKIKPLTGWIKRSQTSSVENLLSRQRCRKIQRTKIKQIRAGPTRRVPVVIILDEEFMDGIFDCSEMGLSGWSIGPHQTDDMRPSCIKVMVFHIKAPSLFLFFFLFHLFFFHLFFYLILLEPNSTR